ncbi:MAG: helix-turn-helix domain-containing protein, partial [Treponemataceae bacterium]|nr:helix-turn-helix domain-containing protein [Treponemataceae bacterium]
MNENEIILKQLGQKLKQLRLNNYLSQEKLAEITGLDRTYISGLERGKRNPSYLIIRRISHVLNIDEQELFNLG